MPVRMSRLSRHSARARGRARRRLRHLRRLRELQLRDAGGLVFDLYRFGERREALVRAKFDAIIATDKEIRALEQLLGETGGDRVLELRLPGIGGTCHVCNEFHASDARFCAACGTPLAETPPAPVAQPAPPQEAPARAAPEEAAVSEAHEGVVWTEEVAAAPEEVAHGFVEESVVRLGESAPEEAPAAESAPEPVAGAVPEFEPEDTEEHELQTDESGEVAAVGPRRARSGSGRPPRRRGSSR